MKGRAVTAERIAEFKEHLILNERSSVTVEKYIRDVKVCFLQCPSIKYLF